MVTTIRYKLHFATLALAVPLLLVIGYTDLFADRGFFVGYAPLGVLHATSLVISLRKGKPLAPRFAFVLLAGIVSGLAPLAGLFGASPMEALTGALFPNSSGLQDSLNLLGLFAIASAFGASMYWLLVRWFWIRKLSARSLGTTVIACAFATLLSVLIQGPYDSRVTVLRVISSLLLTVTWWFAFSGSLYWSETRGHKRLVAEVTELS